MTLRFIDLFCGIGGFRVALEKSGQGRSTKSKMLVVGVRQRQNKVKARSIDKLSSDKIQQFLNENVEAGSRLAIDEARFYKPVKSYSKMVVNHSVDEVDTKDSINSLIKNSKDKRLKYKDFIK